MRKEIFGILLFFLVIFVLVSLLTYSPDDPSPHNITSTGEVRNGFGVLGAHTAGFLIGAFGLGALWIPVVLFITGLNFLRRQPGSILGLAVAGGLLLVVTTGALTAFAGARISLLGTEFDTGGIVGVPINALMVRYTNPVGAAVILTLMWLVGLIMATGFSLVAFWDRGRGHGLALYDRFATRIIKYRERRRKARRRTRVLKEKPPRKAEEIQIKSAPPKPIRSVPAPRQEVFEFMRVEGEFRLPPVSLLADPEARPSSVDAENLRMQSRLLEKKLEDFGVRGQVAAVSPGPVITTFEYEPAAGVKINRIVNLTDDLALALRALSIRIVAPIPGKAVIGIEVPNSERELVRFKEIVSSRTFDQSRSRLTMCLGKDIVGNPVVAELERMPHLLIAGATGTGKSVGLNAMISSLLYKSTPDQVKFIMIDPKRIELSLYDGIPHLITPVVTDVKKATNALYWAVKEMERRYELMAALKSRNLDQYNRKVVKARKEKPEQEAETLPLIVVVIDELADLMMVASRDVEVALTRLAQMARAAGIHLILATQRPSVDVLTGLIKANFPTRLTYQVSSRTDSRTIIDTGGAENLLGNGDMLFLPPGTAVLQRVHGAYISEAELVGITDYLKKQGMPDYMEEVTAVPVETASSGDEEYDERYDDAVALVTKARQASISMIQRHLRVGYNRAARIIEVMEREGVVGPSDGAKPREVLARALHDPD